MALTAADIQPFINSGAIPQSALNQYYSGNVPSTGGTQTATSGGFGKTGDGMLPNLNPFYSGSNSGIGGILSNPATNPGAIIDPLGSSLLASLFGSDKPTFQKYAQDGKYFWADPNKKNPVPIAALPGAPLSPNKNYQNTAGNMQAMYDLLPYLNQAVNAGAVPTAISQLQASQITSPAYAEMMTRLYNTYGPQLNEIGNEILKRNALAQTNTDNAVITGPGKDLVKHAYDLSQTYDKPYYDSRQLEADNLKKLFDSIDLSGGLSGTERNEIAQGISRTGVQNGTLNAPSQTNTVSNAMRYGQAGNARQQQAKSNLSAALTNASAFLPASKSGVDVFQVATGRPSQANPGASQFTGLDKSSNNSAQYGLAGSLLGGMNNSDITQMNINANKKDWLDQFNQFASGIGSLTGSAGGVAGMLCWVAREVYGTTTNEWQQFRAWLFTKAPLWLFDLYLKHGKQFAEFIKDKPVIKYVIRRLMNLAIKSL